MHMSLPCGFRRVETSIPPLAVQLSTNMFAVCSGDIVGRGREHCTLIGIIGFLDVFVRYVRCEIVRVRSSLRLFAGCSKRQRQRAGRTRTRVGMLACAHVTTTICTRDIYTNTRWFII